jgi:hypothetical protein
MGDLPFPRRETAACQKTAPGAPNRTLEEALRSTSVLNLKWFDLFFGKRCKSTHVRYLKYLAKADDDTMVRCCRSCIGIRFGLRYEGGARVLR